MDDEELFLSLAERLRAAHSYVASLVLPEAEKSNVLRHLRVITDASKHDLRRASERLDAFIEELRARP